MKKIVKLILIVIWMILIFCFSNQKADDSSKLSDGLIVKVANVFIKKDLSTEKKEEILEKYTTIVRKTAHFTIYFVLGVLVISFICEFNINKAYLLSLIICLLYACTDEFHQTFISGRSGELRDVIIDTSGTLFGIVLYRFFIKKCRKNKS